MSTLLLNTSSEEQLIQAISSNHQKAADGNYCYVFTTAYFSSDGGGGIAIKGVYHSIEKAAETFIKAIRREFNNQNEEYAEEGEIYFEKEPFLDIWEEQAGYQFRCKNYLDDVYEWQLTPKILQ